MAVKSSTPNPHSESAQTWDEACWRFADFELNSEKAELRRAGHVVPATALSLSLLDYLVRHRERVVGREELIARVWRGVAVGEGALRQAIWELRQKLGGSADSQSFIQTVRGRGYRFVAGLELDAGAAAANPSESLTAAEHPSLSGAPPALAGHAAYGLFGRDEELERLHFLLRSSLEEGGRACAIVGPAGVGKSRLARELSHSAVRQGYSVVAGHTDPDRVASPFWCWLQMISAYLEARPDRRAQYVAAAPAVFRLLDGQGHLRVAPQHAEPSTPARLLLLTEMGKLFVTMANDAPGLILLEDLQWSDEASLSFLSSWLPLLARTRSLLLVTCRAFRARDERAVARALQALGRSACSDQIELRNLTEAAVGQMLAAHAGSALPGALSARVFEISRGNPLFANELSRLLAKLDQRSEPETAGLLEVQWVIKRRLEALPETAREAVVAAAVLSPDFSLAELAGVLCESAASTLARLDECLEQEVFADGPAGRFCFAHPLFREAAYTLLSREERARLHRLAGEWLESQAVASAGTRLSELARHFVAAAPNDCALKAIKYCVECAQLAYDATAYAAAVRHYKQGLACAELDAGIDPAQRLDIELLLGEALRASGADTSQVNQHFLQLAQRAEALESPTLFARAVLGYTGQQSVRFTPTRFPASCHTDQVSLLERALAGLGSTPSALRALLLCSLTGALLYSTDRLRREAAASEARQIAEELGLPWLKVRALATQIHCCAAPEKYADRRSACDLLVQTARDHGLHAQEADSLMTRAILRLSIGDAAEAQADVERARLVAEKVEQPQVRSRCNLVELMRAVMEGDLPRAKQLTEDAAAADPEDVIERAFFALRLATLDALEHGLRPQTVQFHERMLAEFPEAVGIHALLASVYATLRQRELALQHFDFVAAEDFQRLPENATWLGEMAMLADTAIRLDDRERALAVYRRLSPYGHLFDFYIEEVLPGGPIAYWLAELAVTLGDYPAAERWLRVSGELNARLGATLFQHFDMGCKARLLARRDPERAPDVRELLRQIVAYVERSGVRLLLIAVGEAERELARRPAS